MMPSRNFSLPAEMGSPDVRKIFRILGGGSVRFVGGCVRNAVLGEVIGDIDLATTHTPQYVTDRLSKNGIKTIPTGIQHGTVTAVIKGRSFEITTLRIDKKSDGRHAEVEFSEDWYADACRRDFTINALYADLDGKIYDPLGCGLRDLEKRRVSFVGNPDLRIREDYLRILRFFRFSLYYGLGKLDRKGYGACVLGARGLKNLSRERLSQEFFKILSHPDCPAVLEKMCEAKCLSAVFSKSFDPKSLKKLISCQNDEVDDVSVVARVFLVAGGGKASLANLSKCLILNKKQKQAFEDFSRVKFNTNRPDMVRIRSWMVEDGLDFARARLDICFALGLVSRASYVTFVGGVLSEDVPEFPVRARDLMVLGYQGAALGNQLALLRKKWARSDYTKDKGSLLKTVIPI
jgi:poly(A) polymerase